MKTDRSVGLEREFMGVPETVRRPSHARCNVLPCSTLRATTEDEFSRVAEWVYPRCCRWAASPYKSQLHHWVALAAWLKTRKKPWPHVQRELQFSPSDAGDLRNTQSSVAAVFVNL